MVTREDDSVKLACGDVRAARAALAHSTKRVAYCARRRARYRNKRADADVELLVVSAKQLRIVGFASVLAPCGIVLEGFAPGYAMHAIDARQLIPAHVVAAMCPSIGNHLLELCRTGRVATGDGLRVVSSAGPGLKWFKPHSRNEFSVVLAQSDGSAPAWLTAGDIVVSILPTATSQTSSAPLIGLCLQRRGHCSVSVVYEGLVVDCLEVGVGLVVCGAVVADAAGDSDWCVRVSRRPLADHSCFAVGTHVETLSVACGVMSGMAVSADEKWLVVGLVHLGSLHVYSLPGGELVRAFGCCGAGPLQFRSLARLCFAPNGDLVVVDRGNKRLQQVTLEGVFVRFIGVGEFGNSGGQPECVAVFDDVIAVGFADGTGPRVALLDFDSGAVLSKFGEVGTAPGRLGCWCTGIRFTADGSHVVVAENEARRLSLFTTAGEFVRCVGVGVLGEQNNDVLQSMAGEYVVADNWNNSVCVFSPDGSELVRSWVVEATDEGRFMEPAALAIAGKHLYVMDSCNGCIQVFE